jgi:hypothetical protein
MRRYLLSLSAAAIVCGFLGTPSASAQQSLNLFIGGFTPAPFDARDPNDVLLHNSLFLTTYNRANSIDVSQFDYWKFGGEWLFALGRYFDGGLGVGYYQKTVPVIDIYNINGTTGTNIAADLKLRIVPFSATIRYLPIGHHAMEPYVGAGVNVYYWRYSETGQFVDYSNQPSYGPCPSDVGCNIITGAFVGSGGAVGPVFLGGVRVPLGPLQPGFEIRYDGGATGDLPLSQGFSGSKIDLSGMNYLFTLNLRF